MARFTAQIVFVAIVVFWIFYGSCDPNPNPDPLTGIYWVKTDDNSPKAGAAVFFPNNSFGWTTDTLNIGGAFTPKGLYLWGANLDTLVMAWDSVTINLKTIATPGPDWRFYDQVNESKLIFEPL